MLKSKNNENGSLQIKPAEHILKQYQGAQLYFNVGKGLPKVL